MTPPGIPTAGKATITLTTQATDTFYETTKTVNVQVAKAANTLTVKAKKVKAKAASLSKGSKKIARKKALAVTNAKGALTFSKKAGNSKIAVTKKGALVLQKGLRAGTYKVRVAVRAKGTANSNAKLKTVKIVVKVK